MSEADHAATPDPVDLRPAAERLTALVGAISQDDLGRPTPCEIPVSRLLAHIDGLALAFRVAAEDPDAPILAVPPSVGRDVLEPGWEQRIPERLDRLAQTWRTTPQDGAMTRVGGIDLPRSIAVQIALQEIVLHGWDLARSVDRSFDVEAGNLAVVHHTVRTIAESDAPREGLFGPVVPVPDDAPVLDRTVGMAGRRPDWAA
jgi:uncharacterized protein (TIGR03086 family)